MSLPIRITLVGATLCLLAGTAAGQKAKPKPAPAKRTATLVIRKPQEAAPDTSPVQVNVRVSSESVGRAFTLGEIADITGQDKAFIAQLAAVEIGAAPLPGQTRSVLPGEILVKLRANHLESARVTIIAPPSFKVTRARRDVAWEELGRIAVASLQAELKNEPDTTLEPVLGSQDVSLPKGQVEFRPGAYRGRIEQGMVYVPISLFVDGRPNQTVEVTVKIKRQMRVLIANRQIEPNETLTADDVALARIELPPGFAKPLSVTKEAIGKRAKRRILADAPISASYLETPIAIASNARITIEYLAGPVRITVPGVARQSGSVGDFIRVYAPETRKELEAQVVDNQTVRIADGTASNPETPSEQK